MILSELKQIRPKLPTDDEAAIEAMETLLEGFQRACEWYEAVLGGDAAANRFRESARALGELARTKLSNVPFDIFRKKATVAVTKLAEIAEAKDIAELARLLIEIPPSIPTIPPRVIDLELKRLKIALPTRHHRRTPLRNRLQRLMADPQMIPDQLLRRVRHPRRQ